MYERGDESPYMSWESWAGPRVNYRTRCLCSDASAICQDAQMLIKRERGWGAKEESRGFTRPMPCDLVATIEVLKAVHPCFLGQRGLARHTAQCY